MIRNNLEQVQQQIYETANKCGRNPEDIKLVAVSKRFGVDAIKIARDAGHYIFGENYLQEAAEKKTVLGETVKFHFIGHLQSNKAKIAAEVFDIIETVDRFKIASALNRHLFSIKRRLDILVQVNIGHDEHKSGISPDSAAHLLKQIKELPQLCPRGLMTITPITVNHKESRSFFRELRTLGEHLQNQGLLPEDKIELSMGMSNDYHIAIEEGATIIRIGTAIFGQRPPR